MALQLRKAIQCLSTGSKIFLYSETTMKQTKLPFLLSALLGVLATGTSTPAQAVPSFSRQTGQECANCHIGSFGPQLTPYGIKFKLGGYTDSDGKEGHIPLSGMVAGSYTHTSKDQSGDVGNGFGNNDNSSLQQASVFFAGRLSEHLGSFTQVTYSEPDRKVRMDNLDLRYATTLQIDEKDTVVGVSLNNNPTVSDPFNTVPAWRFPYISSGMAVGPQAATLIEGSLAQKVVGASLYGLYDNNWYAELGVYDGLSQGALTDIHVDPGDKLDGVAPYWRLGYFKDMHKQAFSLGVFGLTAHLLPGWTPGPTDKYRDFGVDSSYQYLGTREHVFALNGSFINEHRAMDASDPASSTGHLNRADLSASYHYDKTYGVTLGLFDISGSSSATLYAPAADSGSRTGSPNTNGYTMQFDWTPFGKEASWQAPWANMRLGLQYTGYEKFNGARDNYDGFGRNARDNNTLYTFIWFAI
ncbi:MAG: cytochrome C [Magnetococcales bacterium]|nr:cytochrome C [Magnetococcales bacterium]